jgi:hypothetical protein
MANWPGIISWNHDSNNFFSSFQNLSYSTSFLIFDVSTNVTFIKGCGKVHVLNANIMKDQLFLRAQICDIVFLDDIEQIDRGQDIV